MKQRDDLDPYIFSKLKILDEVPPRDDLRAADGKAAFLKESASLNKAVSLEADWRHKKWKDQPKSIFFKRRKEFKPMFSTISAIILAVTLLLGGGGATLAAAQASVPGDLLYDIKLFSEDALMSLTADPDAQLELALDLQDRRAEEIQTLLDSGVVVTDDLQIRFREQIEESIMLALNLPEDLIIEGLEKIQLRLQTEEQLFYQTRTNGSENAIMALTQLRDTIQERLQLLENGQTNLLLIQNQVQNQEQVNNPDQKSTNAPSESGSDEAPGTGVGNPWTEGTPTPGSGYGPGENNNSWTEGTPTPGSAFGPGEGNNTQSAGPTLDKGYSDTSGGNGGFEPKSPDAPIAPTPTRTAKPAGNPGNQGGNH